MYCRKCGTQIAEGMSFCTNCGERAVEAEAAPEKPVEQPAELSPAQEAPAYTEAAYSQTDAAYSSEAESTIVPPVIPAEPNAKTDFGKGALAFCLVVIGLLAISTGVFAGLYFSLL